MVSRYPPRLRTTRLLAPIFLCGSALQNIFVGYIFITSACHAGYFHSKERPVTPSIQNLAIIVVSYFARLRLYDLPRQVWTVWDAPKHTWAGILPFNSYTNHFTGVLLVAATVMWSSKTNLDGWRCTENTREPRLIFILKKGSWFLPFNSYTNHLTGDLLVAATVMRSFKTTLDGWRCIDRAETHFHSKERPMITSIQLTNHLTGDLLFVAPADLEYPAMKSNLIQKYS